MRAELAGWKAALTATPRAESDSGSVGSASPVREEPPTPGALSEKSTRTDRSASVYLDATDSLSAATPPRQEVAGPRSSVSGGRYVQPRSVSRSGPIRPVQSYRCRVARLSGGWRARRAMSERSFSTSEGAHSILSEASAAASFHSADDAPAAGSEQREPLELVEALRSQLVADAVLLSPQAEGLLEQLGAALGKADSSQTASSTI